MLREGLLKVASELLIDGVSEALTILIAIFIKQGLRVEQDLVNEQDESIAREHKEFRQWEEVFVFASCVYLFLP